MTPITPRFGPCCGLSRIAQSAGESVSALMADRNIATATVTANCRNNSPEIPEIKATGTNTASKHQRDRDDRREDALHRELGRLRRRKLGMRFHRLFDGLDDHDGIVDHDADRQDHREERDRVGGIPDGVEDDEGADQADRHRDHRNERGADVAEEDEDHQQHQNGRFHQRMLDLFDRGCDEGGWVVGDLPGDVLGKRLSRCRSSVF